MRPIGSSQTPGDGFGSPYPAGPISYGPRPSIRNNGQGTAALALGVISIVAIVIALIIRANVRCTINWSTFAYTCTGQGAVTFFSRVSLLAGIVGVPTGIVAIVSCRARQANNWPAAVIGLCLSSIIVLILLIGLIALGSLM